MKSAENFKAGLVLGGSFLILLIGVVAFSILVGITHDPIYILPTLPGYALVACCLWEVVKRKIRAK